MDQEELLRKAEAFDRIIHLYRNLEKTSGFGSSNWVILSELLEKEIRALEESN